MLKKIDLVAAKILRAAVIIMCSLIAVILMIRVIIRFTPLNISLSWTDEIVEMLMAWMIFTASTLIMRDGDHFKVDILQTRYADRQWMKILNFCITVVSIVFIVSLLYYSMILVQKAVQFTPILKIPTSYLYASIPVNCVLMLLYLVRDLIVNFQKIIGKSTEKGI